MHGSLPQARVLFRACGFRNYYVQNTSKLPDFQLIDELLHWGAGLDTPFAAPGDTYGEPQGAVMSARCPQVRIQSWCITKGNLPA